ncbi:hypothetical protein RHSIM_Rhsim09G0020100 [Rhododendron simsii]|uniref:Uncharacterized protein n=1 Tax=Rhododendron simsii TaxID=118357 RepID=A0A834LEE8_RHOSS|nr:hypothetical protein RHSIM_Rhsim09G0020100 [Rhododendron simsii]
METVCDCCTATGDTIGNTTKHLASLSVDQFVQMNDMKEDTMPTALDIGMETVSDCRTATGDTIGNTTKHLASLSLDQFVQMDESGKIEEECDTEISPDDQGCETHDEAEDKKEDTMPTAPNIGMETVCDCRTATGDTTGNTTKHLAPLSLDQCVQMDDMKEDTMPTDPNDLFKTIIFYPPGVELPPPDFVEEVRRPSPREMMFRYAFLQKMLRPRCVGNVAGWSAGSVAVAAGGNGNGSRGTRKVITRRMAKAKDSDLSNRATAPATMGGRRLEQLSVGHAPSLAESWVFNKVAAIKALGSHVITIGASKSASMEALHAYPVRTSIKLQAYTQEVVLLID